MLVTEGVGYAAEALDAANRGQRVRQRRAAADPALGAGGRQLASEIALCDRRKPFGSVPCRRTFAMRELHRSCKAKRRSEEHTSELQSLMRISYAVLCLTQKSHNILSIDQNSK